MRKYIARFSRTNTIFAILALLFLASLGVGNWPSGARQRAQKDKLPQVKNETESFQLVSAEKIDFLLQLRLKNISKKAITAYKIGYGNGWQTGIDKIIGDDMVAPGEIEEFRTPFNNISNSDDPASPQSVTILAVVFDDRSSEGDFQAADEILNDRLGQKMQLERINRLIQAVLKSPDANTPAALGRLKSQIASLSEDQGKGQPFAIHIGLYYVKQQVLKQIEYIEEWQQSGKALLEAELYDSVNLQDALVKLKKLGEKRIAKL
jgi:hypothetical protein